MGKDVLTLSDGPGSPIRVWIPGDPKGWPRPIPVLHRHRGKIRCSDKLGCRVKVVPGQADKAWRKVIASRVSLAVGRHRPWFQEGDCLVLACRFNMKRPKSHFVACDRSRELKASAPPADKYGLKPDYDNLAKTVADTLQAQRVGPGLLFSDDCCIDVGLQRKLWADPKKGPGLDLIVCRVQDATGDVWAWLMH